MAMASYGQDGLVGVFYGGARTGPCCPFGLEASNRIKERAV